VEGKKPGGYSDVKRVWPKEMRKISYRSSPVVRVVKKEKGCLLTPHGAEEGLSGDMSGDGGAGIGSGLVSPGESVLPPTFKADELAPALFDVKPTRRSRMDYKDLMEILTTMADDLDDSFFRKDSRLVDFAEFAVRKISEQNNLDYSNLFKDAIVRLAKSDIIGANQIILTAVRTYSRAMVIEYRASGDQKSAERAAYQRAIGKIDEALQANPIEKSAQLLESSPVYVAEELHKIMKIMISRISLAKRPGSYDSLSRHIREFNTLEISNKNTPGGAAIGASLGLVKNVLNGRDPYFINIVLKELINRL
jgi:hypothetical protein